jgi:FtsH-binding integral membrane protein
MRTTIYMAGIGIGVMFAGVSNGTSNLGLLATIMFILLGSGAIAYDVTEDVK